MLLLCGSFQVPFLQFIYSACLHGLPFTHQNAMQYLKYCIILHFFVREKKSPQKSDLMKCIKKAAWKLAVYLSMLSTD